MIIDLDYSYRPLELIRTGFELLPVGGVVTISSMLYGSNNVPMPFGYLPDRTNPPYAFSLKQTIIDALNAICPQAPDNIEELPSEVQQALANESEGQNMWKLVDLRIEGSNIVAVVKKL